MIAKDAIDECFVFEIPPPQSRRVIALVLAAIFLLQGAYFFHRAGLSRISYALIWLIIFIFASMIALSLRLGFPPRRSWPRLSVQKDCISYLPGRAQRFNGDSAQEVSITPRSTEILFCRNGFDGYLVMIRAANKTEHEIKARFLTHLDANQCRDITDGITAATGLPVRLMVRRQSMTGGIEEMPWIPTARKTNFELVVALTLGAVPFVGGIFAGYFVTRPTIIVILGFALWLSQILASSAYGKHKWTRRTILYSLTTLFTFGAAYSFAVVIVAFLFRPH
jgi:hypothetical protein